MMKNLPDDIEQVIPHRGAMRLIDRVLDWSEESVTVALTVPWDGPFHQAGGVPVWVGIEYMAQAIAAWSGCRARSQGGSPKVGFLLGARRYSAEADHFTPGARLRVEATSLLAGDNGLGMFACRILEGDRVLASANVSVYEPDDARAAELLAS